MPNYCDNVLKIYAGSKKELEAFVKKHFNGDNLDFRTIVPYPTSKETCSKEYFIDSKEQLGIMPIKGMEWFDWYNFNWNNWGTKWNAFDGNYNYSVDEKGRHCLNVFYETAWNPSTPVIKKLKEMYPDLFLEFMYYECGMEIAGYYNSDGIEYDLEGGSDSKEYRDWIVEMGFEDQEYWDEVLAQDEE